MFRKPGAQIALRLARVILFSLVTLFLTHCSEEHVGIASGSTVDWTPAVPANDWKPSTKHDASPDWKTASFTGRYALALDFLIVIDNSDSMGDETTSLKNSLNGLMTTLSKRRTIDIQAAVTVTDPLFLEKCRDPRYHYDSCASFSGNLLTTANGTAVLSTKSTPNFVGTFQGLLDRIPETDFMGWESGLSAAEKAIQHDGKRFQRDGVPTAVVVISDAEDQSSVEGTTVQQWKDDYTEHLLPASHFANFFSSLTHPVQFYPFGAKSKATCPTLEMTSTRYFEVATLLGSDFMGSVCVNESHDDIHEGLIQLAKRLEAKGNCYPLPADASGAKEYTVTVDGTDVPLDATKGFFVDGASRSVCFGGDLNPGQGAAIAVRYR
jgi:hypothetical protein